MAGTHDHRTPQNIEDWMREVEKRLQRQERRLGSAVGGTVTGDGAPVRVTQPSVGVIPTAPPESAPTLEATGVSDGVVVVAKGVVAQTTVLDYYINDELVLEGTTSMVVYHTRDANGDSLLPETDYTFHVVARNDFGAVASAPVVGRIDGGVNEEMVLGWVAAGFILAGQITVGQIQIRPASEDDPGGITIPLLNGGIIDLPADGSAAIFKGIILRAEEAIFENNMVIQGALNSIEGALRLAAGVVAPTSKPTAVPRWDEADQWLDTDFPDYVGTLRGLYDNGTEWIVAEDAGRDGAVWAVDKTTGGVDTPPLIYMEDFRAFGVTKVVSGGVTTWFVLTKESDDNGGAWWVRRFNSSWGALSSWAFNYSDTGAMFPHIATDGTDIYIARTAGPSGGGTQDRLIVRKFTTTGTLIGSAIVTDIGVGTKANLTGFYVGATDMGGNRHIATSVSQVWVTTTAGVRQQTSEWTRANNDSLLGVSYDGTKFNTLGTGRVWHYDPVPLAVTHSITSTKFDSVGTTHETDASPALSYVQGPRTRFRVTVDPVGGAGGVDDPDSARIYIANKRQADLGAGVWEATYIVPSTAGAAAPTVNEFLSVNASPGSLVSVGEDALGPLIDLRGTGIERLAGLTDGPVDYTPTTITNLTNYTIHEAKYQKFADGMVEGWVDIEMSGASGGAGVVNISLPTGMHADTYTWSVLGSATIRDNSPAGNYSGACIYVGGNNMSAVFNTTRLAVAAPITYAASDRISLKFRYRDIDA